LVETFLKEILGASEPDIRHPLLQLVATFLKEILEPSEPDVQHPDSRLLVFTIARCSTTINKFAGDYYHMQW
jgi:ERCC4-related helicase